jgi:hypothetical protein
MIILRQPPYQDLVSYTLEPSTEYSVVIREHDGYDLIYQDSLLSDLDGLLTVPWAGTYGEANTSFDFRKYDELYSLEIFDGAEIVVEDTLTIERPYVNPNTLGTTNAEIAAATQRERIARAIIDAITGGFYFKTGWIETVGQHTDYLSLWDRVYKIIRVYENAKLVYDSFLDVPALGDWNYLITKDKTAIIKDPVGGVDEFNRSESRPVGLDVAVSDSFSLFDTADSGNVLALKPGVLFPEGVDYIIQMEYGYKVVPGEIQDAVKMLIDDIACNRLDYFKRHIINYSTDQFRITVDKSALDGTGNMLVDKILEKYVTDVKRPGVL